MWKSIVVCIDAVDINVHQPGRLGNVPSDFNNFFSTRELLPCYHSGGVRITTRNMKRVFRISNTIPRPGAPQNTASSSFKWVNNRLFC